jgi:hypothetical protein
MPLINNKIPLKKGGQRGMFSVIRMSNDEYRIPNEEL